MKEKNAICFFGAVSKGDGGDYRFSIPNPNGPKSSFINFLKVADNNKKNIIEENPTMDVFIHCWHSSLKSYMVDCYNPKSYLFESNSLYKDELKSKCFTKSIDDAEVCNKIHEKQFNRNSFFLTISKSINLMLEYANQNNIIYDNVLVCRPDVVLKKKFKLNETTKPNTVISNYNSGHAGDFFFLMDMESSKKFAAIYKSLDDLIEHDLYNMPKDFSIKMGLKFEMEEKIQTPKDIELARNMIEYL